MQPMRIARPELDPIRPDAAAVIAELRRSGLSVVMLTGETELQTAVEACSGNT